MDVRSFLLVSVLLLFLIVPCSFAATLKGTVYHADLSVAKNVVVTIDTQPQQRLLSLDGAYEFMVPEGEYILRVFYSEKGFNESYTENLTVAKDGVFTYDLFLLPNLDNEEGLYFDVTDDLVLTDELDGVALGGAVATSGDGPWPLVVFIVVILLLLIVPIVWMKRHFRKLDVEYAKGTLDARDEADGANVPDAKLEQVVAILKKEGGRMTQKELRAKLPDSEAKVSLMISELEHAGRVARIKKGRGNIIVLKK